MKGEGVLETFVGLVQLTWAKLERDNQLDKKFQIRVDEVLQSLIDQVDSRAGTNGGAP